MKRYIIPLLATILLLAACNDSQHGYSVKGTINNLEGQSIYAVYTTEEGVAIDTLRPQDGYIELHGFSHDYRPIQLYFASWQPFMRLYMRNGINIELSGDAHKKYQIKMDGGDINNELWDLLTANAETLNAIELFYNDTTEGAAEKLNKNIQRIDSLYIGYIKANPENVLSSFILTDFLLKEDNYPLCKSLWEGISDKARTTHSATIMTNIEHRQEFAPTNKTIPYMRHLDYSDSLLYINPRNSHATLLCVWEADRRDSHTIHETLEQYANRYEEEDLQVVALSFDSDTAIWHKAVEADTTHVIDIWYDGVFTSSIWEPHKITNTPVYMLGDAYGNILVRTSQLPDTDIDAQIDSLINIPQYKLAEPIFNP